MEISANNNISDPIAKPINTMRNQSQEHRYTQQTPQPVSQSVFFEEKRKTTTDRHKNYPFFQQNKNSTNKLFIRSQPHYSEDEDYFKQKKQQ